MRFRRRRTLKHWTRDVTLPNGRVVRVQYENLHHIPPQEVKRPTGMIRTYGGGAGILSREEWLALYRELSNDAIFWDASVYREPLLAWPKVEPASKISSWGGWPPDVVATLHRWNKQRYGKGWRLSFSMGAYWPTNRPRVFKCWRCERFHEQPKFGLCMFEEHAHCDECMIEMARENVAKHLIEDPQTEAING